MSGRGSVRSVLARVARTSRARRATAVGLSLALAGSALAGGLSLAGHLTTDVPSYTGCLNLAAGTISSVQVGLTPKSACSSGQVEIHFSGGDITSITTPTAGGLEGGVTNGAATLGLRDSYKLPQTCTNGQPAEWDGTRWACGTDENTTYTGGTGLTQIGTELSIAPTYRLPQNCAANGEQITRWNGSSWVCAANGSKTYLGMSAGSSLCNTAEEDVDPTGELPPMVGEDGPLPPQILCRFTLPSTAQPPAYEYLFIIKVRARNEASLALQGNQRILRCELGVDARSTFLGFQTLGAGPGWYDVVTFTADEFFNSSDTGPHVVELRCNAAGAGTDRSYLYVDWFEINIVRGVASWPELN